MKKEIEKIINELEENYDYYLEKFEDPLYYSQMKIFEERLHDIRIEINTYKKVLEILDKVDKEW